MHEPLPPVRGLMDGLSFALQMAEWDWQIRETAYRLGFESDAVGAPGILDRFDRFEGPYYRAPGRLAAPVIDAFARATQARSGSRPKGIYTGMTCLCGRWWEYLRVLDTIGKICPACWVRRDALPSPPPALLRDIDPDTSARVEPYHRLLREECQQQGEDHSRSAVIIERRQFQGGIVCGGLELERNPAWVSDIISARQMIKAPTRRVGAAKSHHTVSASRATVAFWRIRWVLRPTLVFILQTRKSLGMMHLPFPELAAIPFYRKDDAKLAFSTVVESYVCVPLLDNVSDTQIARERWIAHARDELGLPRLETRGRRRGRPLDKVTRVGDMIRKQGLTKYRVAKVLHISRSTVTEYLKEYDRRQVQAE